MPSENSELFSWNMYCDGASRGNPGPASTGVIVYESTGNPIIQNGYFLGVMTNNEAEYSALARGLELVFEHFEQNKKIQSGFKLNIFLDSELVVKQIKGEYKVKKERLKPLHAKVKNLLVRLSSYSIQHVPREKNKEADALANEALDAAV